jgi:hypothetical protein
MKESSGPMNVSWEFCGAEAMGSAPTRPALDGRITLRANRRESRAKRILKHLLFIRAAFQGYQEFVLQRVAVGCGHNRTASGSERVIVTTGGLYAAARTCLLPLAVLFRPPATPVASDCKLL